LRPAPKFVPRGEGVARQNLAPTSLSQWGASAPAPCIRDGCSGNRCRAFSPALRTRRCNTFLRKPGRNNSDARISCWWSWPPPGLAGTVRRAPISTLGISCWCGNTGKRVGSPAIRVNLSEGKGALDLRAPRRPTAANHEALRDGYAKFRHWPVILLRNWRSQSGPIRSYDAAGTEPSEFRGIHRRDNRVGGYMPQLHLIRCASGQFL
jgi:hypothetical protein